MRVVIAGLGVQGRKRREVAGNSVVGIVDPVAGEADYKAIEEVSLSDYDAVCVCVPEGAKPAMLRYLLSNGKHVLVEKPLMIPATEILELAQIAKKNAAACYTAYNHRFEPHITSLKGVIKSGTLGRLYLARFFYGNGTARDVKNSAWRDRGLGVVNDLGSHLLDMSLFLFEQSESAPELWSENRFENNSPDHATFGFRGAMVQEMSATFLSWKNTFTLDLIGEFGSAHIHGLCKWGPSTLTLRKRILPSGRPVETVETLEQSDPTWRLEYDHFLNLCKTGGTNLPNDIWIQDQIQQLGGRLDP